MYSNILTANRQKIKDREEWPSRTEFLTANRQKSGAALICLKFKIFPRRTDGNLDRNIFTSAQDQSILRRTDRKLKIWVRSVSNGRRCVLHLDRIVTSDELYTLGQWPLTVYRQLASLTGQCRQVYCLVEMAPSAPTG